MIQNTQKLFSPTSFYKSQMDSFSLLSGRQKWPGKNETPGCVFSAGGLLEIVWISEWGRYTNWEDTTFRTWLQHVIFFYSKSRQKHSIPGFVQNPWEVFEALISLLGSSKEIIYYTHICRNVLLPCSVALKSVSLHWELSRCPEVVTSWDRERHPFPSSWNSW